MTRRILVVMVLAILAVYAGSAMAQASPPRPAAPPEQPSAVPAPPAAEWAPEAAQQPPAPPQTKHSHTTRAPFPVGEGQPIPPPELGKWWKSSEIVAALQLAPEQISQLEKAFIDHRLKLINLQAALEVGEVKLQALLEDDRPDEAKVIAQIDQVTAARGSLEKENAMMMLGVRRVLSVEQWKKLQEIQQMRIEIMPMKKRMPMERPPVKHPAPTAPRPPGE